MLSDNQALSVDGNLTSNFLDSHFLLSEVYTEVNRLASTASLPVEEGHQNLDIFYHSHQILRSLQQSLLQLVELQLQHRVCSVSLSTSKLVSPSASPISLSTHTSKNLVVSFAKNLTYSELIAHLVALRTDYIQRIARPVVHKLFLHPKNGGVFNRPVDPVALGIPSYFHRIQTPMDLGTVRSRLHCGEYETIEKCFDDVRLVFKNSIQFNGEGHFITKIAKDLLEEFEGEVKLLVEKSHRDFCKRSQHKCSTCRGCMCVLCGEKCLKFETPNLFCHGTNCGQKIRRNAVYYISPDGSALYCQKCHSSLPPALTDASEQTNSEANKACWNLLKKHLLKRKFDEEISEPLVCCERCGLSFHQICALVHDQYKHLDDSKKSFLCPICTVENGLREISLPQLAFTVPSLRKSTPVSCDSPYVTIPAPSIIIESDTFEYEMVEEPVKVGDKNCSISKWKASNLPRAHLSDFLEILVKDLLERRGFGEVKETVTIRVTSNMSKTMEVPRALTDNFKGEDGSRLKDFMMYKQKCIQLFQTIDGIDVCLFCLYVHEFDDSAPPPNQSTVYIAYLDSVDYFRPMQARSMVYQEIVVGYLLWSQARGFKNCMIWSCPPQRGDSFIFWCHPSHQKTPSRDRLNSWYGSILARSKALGVHDGAHHLWERYFRKFTQREEAPTREAAKRSFVGSGKVAVKKYRKQDNGCRVSSSPESTDLESNSSMEVSVLASENDQFSIPPIFDGDYWVMEFLKLHRIQYQKATLLREQNSSSNFRKCRDILKSIISRPHSVAFRQPVDPIALSIPTYPLIVTNPMDLGTIREKLRSGVYSTVFDFAQDVRLTFHNAMLFNPAGHVVHIQADLLLKEFEKAVEQSFQEEYSVTPKDKSLEEFLAQCKLSNVVNKENTKAVPSSNGPYVINTKECFTPAAKVVTPTPFKAQFHSSPKSVIEDTDDFCEMAGEKTIPRIISQDIEIGEASLSLPQRCDYSSSTPELPQISTNLEITTMSVVYPDVGEGSLELSNRSMSSVLSDLSKAIHRLNDDLFIITLNTAVTNRSTCIISESAILALKRLVPNTTDPDPLHSSPIVDCRYSLLEVCQFKHYQFDSLRRAKHSSLMMLYYLHHPEDCSYRPKCSNCREFIQELRWHCEVCSNYEVCRGCKENLSKQFYENYKSSANRKAKVVEWKPDDEDTSYHPHPLTPYRVTIH